MAALRAHNRHFKGRDHGAALMAFMPILSFVFMATSLVVQGLYFWARDAVSPNLSWGFYISDIVWCVTMCSLFFYRRRPWITIACSWGLVITVATVYWRYYSYYRLSTLLLISCPSAANVLLAHFGLYLRDKQRRAKSPAGVII